MTQTLPLTIVLGPAYTGQAIGYRVLNLNRTSYSAFTMTNVAETAVSGTYAVSGGIAAPDAGGYVIAGTAGVDYAETTIEGITELLAIKTKTDTIGALSVTITAPVATDGTDITIIRGDDYLLADSRQLAFTGTNWPTLTAGVVALRIDTSSVTDVAGVITGAAACYVELTDTQTTALEPGSYSYDLQATLASGSVITLVQGDLIVVADVR